jgi:hypothetical protein
MTLAAMPFPRTLASAQDAPSANAATSHPVLHYGEPVIYTLSLSQDQIANARITNALARDLNRLYQNPHLFMPAPNGWTINDFINQCNQDRGGTRGAVIVMPPSIVAGVQGHVLYRTSYADVGLYTIAANCDQAATSTVVWRSEYHTSSSSAATYTFFYPLLVALSLYVAIAPTKAYATTTTFTHPAPTNAPSAPPSPTPRNGYISGVQTQTTTTINGSGTSGITNGLVGSSENYINNATQVSLIDPVTLNAALKTLHEVARDLAKSCGKDVELIGKDPEPVSSSWFRPKAAGTAGAVLFNPADVCSWNGAGSS